MQKEEFNTSTKILDHKITKTLKDAAPAIPKDHSNFIINTVVGITIYLFTFFIWYIFKRGTFILEDNYTGLVPLYILSIFLASILSNKAFLTPKHNYFQSLRKIYISVFLALGLLSLILLKTDTSTLSRFVIVGSMLSGSILESLYSYILSENKNFKRIIESNPVSYLYTIPDLILLTFVNYVFIINKIGLENLNEKHILVLALVYLSWTYSALFTHRFNPLKQSLNNWSATGLQLKFYLLIFSSTALFVFLINIHPEHSSFFLQGTLVYSIVSFVIFVFLFVRKLPYPTDEVTNVFLKAFELGNPNIIPQQHLRGGKYKFLGSELSESDVKQKLQSKYFKNFPDVFNFLEREIELQSFDLKKTIVIRSSDLYNVEVLNNNSLELFVNLHEINDLRRINDYFRKVNEKMIKDGIYAGNLIPIKNRRKLFQNKYPFLISSFFYFIDFIWHRVFPAIPGFRKLFFNVTKGKDRALSLAEGLGRLVYCGFEIIDLTEINERIFFVAKKVKEPSTDKNPSYSLIFKMKRIGLGGKQIYVYKVRTMHPYSEYIQQFIYDINKLSEGGKFKDDFRISGWGRILRKLWIDELPMLINLLKGDIKLIGVRPISNHYLSLYSQEFQDRRNKYKPGLMPPFYADMPTTIEDIEASEKKYFDLFDRSPLTTDIKYFFKIIFNILFQRKTSS